MGTWGPIWGDGPWGPPEGPDPEVISRPATITVQWQKIEPPTVQWTIPERPLLSLERMVR